MAQSSNATDIKTLYEKILFEEPEHRAQFRIRVCEFSGSGARRVALSRFWWCIPENKWLPTQKSHCFIPLEAWSALVDAHKEVSQHISTLSPQQNVASNSDAGAHTNFRGIVEGMFPHASVFSISRFHDYITVWKHTGRTGLLGGKRADAINDAGRRGRAATATLANAEPHRHVGTSKRTIFVRHAQVTTPVKRRYVKKRHIEAQTTIESQGQDLPETAKDCDDGTGSTPLFSRRAQVSAPSGNA